MRAIGAIEISMNDCIVQSCETMRVYMINGKRRKTPMPKKLAASTQMEKLRTFATIPLVS